jgi:hypothetical protein
MAFYNLLLATISTLVKNWNMTNRFVMKSVFLACVLISYSVENLFSQNRASKTDIEKLTKLEHDWIVAEFALDTLTLSSIMAESFIAIDAAGISDKRQELKEVYGAVVEMRKSEHFIDSLYLDSVQIQTYGNAAVVTFICVTRGRKKNIPFENRRTRFYDVWIKANGNWKAVSSQVTRL